MTPQPQSHEHVSFGTQCLVALVLIFGYGASAVQRQSLATLSSLIGRELHLPYTQIGQIFSAMTFGLIAGYVVLSVVIVLAGTRWGLVAALAGSSVAAAASALAPSYGVLLASRFLLGFFAAGLVPAAVQSAREWFPSHMRPLVIGAVLAGGPAVSLLSSTLITAAMRFVGWRAISIAAALPTLVVAVFCLAMWPRPPAPEPFRGVSTPAIASAGMAALGLLFAAPAYYAVVSYLPVYQSTRGIGISTIRTAASVHQILNMWGALLPGVIAWVMMDTGKQAARVRALLLTICGCLLPLAALGSLHLTAAVLIAGALPGMGYFAWSVLLYWAVADSLPAGGVAVGAGIAGLMGTVGSLAVSALSTGFGGLAGFGNMFLVAGAVAMVGLIAVLALAWYLRSEPAG
jgi:sugar phosphate permease